MLRDRRVRLQFDGVAELRLRFLQFTFLKSRASFRNVELRILIAFVDRGKFAVLFLPLPQLLLADRFWPKPAPIGNALRRLSGPGELRLEVQRSHR